MPEEPQTPTTQPQPQPQPYGAPQPPEQVSASTVPVAPAPVQNPEPVVAPGMDVSQPAISTPQSNPVGDQVWISKEEYQRLQQADAQVVAGGNGEKQGKLFGVLQIITACLAAIALLIGLTAQSYFGALLITPSLIILALMGIFTLVDYARASKAGGYIKSHKARNITMLVLAAIVLILPALIPIGLVLMFMVMCAGGCQGS
jgi:hypothetical protein